jgi:hypothetical protein
MRSPLDCVIFSSRRLGACGKRILAERRRTRAALLWGARNDGHGFFRHASAVDLVYHIGRSAPWGRFTAVPRQSCLRTTVHEVDLINRLALLI